MLKNASLKKITPMLVTLALVFSLMPTLPVREVHATGEWVNVGTPFEEGGSRSGRIAFDPNTYEPYIAYQDSDRSNELYVKKYSGGDWSDVGDSLTLGAYAQDFNIVFPNNSSFPYVSFRASFSPDPEQTYVKQWNGSTWNFIPSDEEKEIGGTLFSHNNDIDVNSSNELYLYSSHFPAFPSAAALFKLSEGDWVQLGGNQEIYKTTDMAISNDDIPYVVGMNKDDDKVYVKKYEGGQWDYVGGALTVGEIFGSKNCAIAFHPNSNVPYVVYSDTDDTAMHVKKWNNSSSLWEEVGNIGIQSNWLSSYPGIDFDGNGNLYVSLNNENQGYVKKWNGTSWEAIGGLIGAPNLFRIIDVAVNPSTNEPYVIFVDDDNSDKVTVKKYQSDEPILNGFASGEFNDGNDLDETTDFSAVGDLTAVPNMILANNQGSIKWTGGTVNAEAANFIDNVKVDNGLVSVDSTALAGRGIDAAATVKMRVNNCEGVALYYSPSAYDSFNDLKTNYQEFCTIDDTSGCSTINSASCRNNILTLTVTGFSSYGAEGVGGVADYVFEDRDSDNELDLDTGDAEDRDVKIIWTRPGAIEYQATDTIAFRITDDEGNLVGSLATCSNGVAPTDHVTVAGGSGGFAFPGNGEAVWTFTGATSTNAMEVCLQMPAEADEDTFFISVLGYTYGGGLIYVNDSNDVTVTATVIPQLEFDILTSDASTDTNACDLGQLTSSATSTCSYRLRVLSNASDGYTVQVKANGPLTSGSHDINYVSDDLVDGDNGGSATEEYGVSIAPGSSSVPTTTLTLQGNFVSGNHNDLGTTAENLVIANGPNFPSSSGDTTNTAEITHHAQVSSDTPTGAYTQTATYYVTASF